MGPHWLSTYDATSGLASISCRRVVAADYAGTYKVSGADILRVASWLRLIP